MKKAISLLFALLLVCTAAVSPAAALSSEKHGWGQGYNVNPDNQPISCIQFNEQYGKLGAEFLSEKKNQIVLTFDEGYENGFTSQILDTLKKEQVSAVFFITYDYAKRNPDLVRRMIAEGHVVGNHTTTHPSMAALSRSEIETELMTLHRYVHDEFGYDMSLMRPPMGEFSEQSLYYTQQLGYKSIFWSFAYKDYDVNAQPDCTTALKRLNEALHPGAIYLLHAVSKTNCQILSQWIQTAKTNRYQFTTEL